MVYYTISPVSRMKVYFIIALISVTIVQLADFWGFTVWGIDVSVPSAFLIYASLFSIYDKYLWKIPVFNMLHDIPDLNEIYAVKITQAGAEKTDCFTGFIEQTFTRIQVQIERSNSISKATTASLDLSTPRSGVLKFSYRHEPTAADPKGYNQGDGFQTLFILDGKMQGACFSTWCRTATVVFTRKKVSMPARVRPSTTL